MPLDLDIVRGGFRALALAMLVLLGLTVSLATVPRRPRRAWLFSLLSLGALLLFLAGVG